MELLCIVSIQRAKPPQPGVGVGMCVIGSLMHGFMFYLVFCLFTENKHHHDHDHDSGMGPSIFTDTKSTTFSEVSYYFTNACILLCGHSCASVFTSALGSFGQRAEGIGL